MTISSDKDAFGAPIKKGFLWGVLIGFALVILGWLLIPSINLLSLGSTLLALGVYGLAGYFGFPRIRPGIFSPASLFGLLGGSIFASEILLEYVVLPKDNTSWGVIEFGSVFAVYFISGLVVAYQSNSVQDGILAGLTSGMLSSVVWLLFILVTFYLFRGTVRQEQVFMAEGNYADFARSGMKDFNTFVMEDFLGAGFFHLLFGPLLAAGLGVIGGSIGKGIARFRS